MSVIYATVDDLGKPPWNLDIDPDVAEKLIARASRLARQATITARYDVDDNGAPTDETIAAAFRDAVCSQVETWTALDIDPAKGAADGGKAVAAKSFGGASIQYSTYASTVEARARAATQLSLDAHIILAEAGLTNMGAVVSG